MKTNKEAAEARALIRWAAYHPICQKALIAIPNGGSRHPLEAHNLKLQGVKAGVSDYFLAYPVQPYGGCWIELKRQKSSRSSLSESQKAWLELMKRYGYQASVAYGWQNAVEVIEDYLKK